MDLNVIEIIRAKRDKKELTEIQIQSFIDKLKTSSTNSTDNNNLRVHEAQIGAFLMAVFLNGLTSNETKALTKAMTFSGYTFKWPEEWKGTVVDKHSTGGVGDKTSLILAPALAACGLRVPMVSGRGLDITGGTLDKLESIPGFNVCITTERMIEILDQVGCIIVGQTADLVPADKELYRIRDTTATVDNENLIVASIISKKAAENLDGLILDIKVGSGALMKNLQDGKSLARNLVKTGNSFFDDGNNCGTRRMTVSGILTTMESPLGYACGNALEVAEAIETLQNKGPEDLMELVQVLGGKLLTSILAVDNFEQGKFRILETIQNGSALSKFEAMLIAQGTNQQIAKELCYGEKWNILPKAKLTTEIYAKQSGYVTKIDALIIGKVCHGLGCGRISPGHPIKYEPGIVLHCKPGNLIIQDETITMTIHHSNNHYNNDDQTAQLQQQQQQKILQLIQLLNGAITVQTNKPNDLTPLILDIVE